MKIEYKINRKEYIKLMFFIVYRKTNSIILTTLGFVAFLLLIYAFITYKIFYLETSTILLNILIILYIFIYYPIKLFFRFKNYYDTNKMLSSFTKTEFLDNKFSDTSDSIYAEIEWKSIYKIEELKSWFLFYQNSTNFGFCPKRVMTESQIKELRNLIKENVKNNSLRND